ncbi:MAG: hypothetical protein WDO06_00195 [Actinomycetota bacterium]
MSGQKFQRLLRKIFIDETKDRALRTRINPGELAQVYESYETLKRQERTIDFEDVLLLTTAMLEEVREVRELVS